MTQVVMMYRTPKDTAAFNEHYFVTHVPLAKMLPGLRHYDVVEDPGPTAFGSDFHLMATFYFDDADSAEWALASPQGKAAEADRRILAPDESDVLLFLVDSHEM
jgi:uncharacterized protein (TIGR02118 family)